MALTTRLRRRYPVSGKLSIRFRWNRITDLIRPRFRRSIVGVLASFLLFPSTTQAHDLEFTFAVVVLRSDGSYQVDFTVDLDALALGVGLGANSAVLANRLATLTSSELETRISDARRVLTEQITLRFDGVSPVSILVFPEVGKLMNDDPPSFLGLTARFTGRIPVDGSTLTVEADRRFPPVYLTIVDQVQHRDMQEIVPRGVTSTAYTLGQFSGEAGGTRWSIVRQYVLLGFQHIIPEGFDHMLFVLGLFLLSPGLAALFWQVSAFTIAHTVTLALSTYGLVALAPDIVEPLIALSIAYVAVENLFTNRMRRSRFVIVFLFGLLHGLGFAGVLGTLGLPDEHFLISLLGFNLGVELGQISVLGAAFCCVGWALRRPWYRQIVQWPASCAIALVGLYLFVLRVFTF